MAAWFNKKTARAMAQMAESLKAESLARAQAEEKLRAEIEAKNAMELKVKAEAEKLLVSQFNRYSLLVERAKAETKEAISAASAQAKDVEGKIQFYASALAQAKEKLSETQEQLKAEALARAKAEESLKAEREERERVEAQVEDAIAAAKAKAEEKVRSYAAALAETEEKSNEAKEQLEVGAIAEAKTEDGLKWEREERQSSDAQPAEVIYTSGRSRRPIFHPVNIERKITLLLVLAIFSALTFTLSVVHGPSLAEPGGAMIREQTPAPETIVVSDTDGGQLNSDVSGEPFIGGLSGSGPVMTNAPALNYESSDNVTFKVSERKIVPVSDAQSLTITAYPVLLKLTGLAGGKANVVQSSDNDRWEARAGSDIYFEFSDVSIGGNAAIGSVVLFVEHFEEERFAEGKLEWSIGTGWPGKPVVWAVMKAPVREGESSETVDAWDITSVVNTVEKIDSLQLQIRNNNNVANGKTLVDYAYVVIEYH